MKFERTVGKELLRLAGQYPVVTVTGPRQSGKTTLCKHTFPDYSYVSLEDSHVREFSLKDPIGFLNQFDNPVVIDEVQNAPKLLSSIQTQVDSISRNGQFILTGSSQFGMSASISQSLAGRTALVNLLPLSFSELYNEEQPELDEVLYKGFYPRIFDQNLDPAEMYSFYVQTYIERDVRQILNVQDLRLFDNFLKLCAGRNGQIVNYASLADDAGIDLKTAKRWLSVLETSYIIALVPPYYNNVNKRLIKNPKLYFYDTGLVCYLLGLQSKDHLLNHPLSGAIFESYVFSEIIKMQFNRIQTSNIHHYRDSRGREVDLILDNVRSLNQVEAKKGQTISSSMFKGLNYLTTLYKNIDKSCLVYGGETSYQREGIQICSWREIERFIG